jgi:iron complex transport system substrate-binding protein
VIAEERLPAAAEVWAVDADAFVVRPGTRVVDGVVAFSTILHPGRCGPPDSATARRVA